MDGRVVAIPVADDREAEAMTDNAGLKHRPPGVSRRRPMGPLGHAIHDYLKRHGERVDELAEAVGVHRVTVSRWIRGVEPSRVALKMLESMGIRSR